MYGVGSVPLAPQMLLSSSRHFRKAGQEGSRASRACRSCFRRRVVAMEDNAVTHPFQIVNEGYQIIALNVRHTLLILLPIKYVAELIWESEYGSVDTMELLQNWGTEQGHENNPDVVGGEDRFCRHEAIRLYSTLSA